MRSAEHPMQIVNHLPFVQQTGFSINLANYRSRSFWIAYRDNSLHPPPAAYSLLSPALLLESC